MCKLLKDQPLVSVIIPAYQCERYLKACIESVLMQTYKNVEVIVVYDPSQDNTWAVLEKYKKNVILIRQGRKTNPSIARNVGLKKARGQYIAFCDADDYFESTKLAKQLRMIEESGADLTYSDVIIVDENDNIVDKRICPQVTGSKDGSYIVKPFITFSSVLARKGLIKNAGHFDENLEVAEDAEYLSRLVNYSKVIRKTPEFLTFHRERSDSLSRNYEILVDFYRIKLLKKYGFVGQILLELPKRLVPHMIMGLFTRPKETVTLLRTLLRRYLSP